MRYMFAINVGRAFADRVDGTALCPIIRRKLESHGYGLSYPVEFRPQAADDSVLDIFSLTTRRATLIVSLAVNRTSFVASDVHAIDVDVLDSLLTAMNAPRDREDWTIRRILGVLPANGGGSGRVAVLGRNGEPTVVSRDVAPGESPPVPAAENPVISQRVLPGASNPTTVGGIQESSAANAAGVVRQEGSSFLSGAKSFIDENRTPFIVGTVVVGIIATTVLVKNVKAIVA